MKNKLNNIKWKKLPNSLIHGKSNNVPENKGYDAYFIAKKNIQRVNHKGYNIKQWIH